MTTDVVVVFQIYQRCKRWNCLPAPGGLLDQDERLMGLLDVMEAEVERIRAKRAEEERGAVMKQQMLSNMRGGRG